MSDINTLIKYIQPSKDNSEPLYRQLAKSINKAINDGVLQHGSTLLAERELATRLNISRVTVRKAIDQLVDIGALHRIHGSGTTIANQEQIILHKKLTSLGSFTADMHKRGLSSYSKIVLREETQATEKEALILNLQNEEIIHRLNRIRFLVNKPLAYEIAVTPASIISINTAIDNSLYNALKKVNMNPVTATQNIHAINADKDIAKKLSIKTGSAVLFMERKSKAVCGKIVEYTKSYYRGDRYNYLVELK